MGQSIDCQPYFGHQVGRRKALYANHAAQVEEKTAVCLLSDRLLGDWFLYQRSWKYSKLENRLRPMSKLTLLMGLVLPLTERT